MLTFKTTPLRCIGAMLVTIVPIAGWSIAKADQPQAEKTSVESTESESVDVRYARAHLELAKLDLSRALEWNKKVPNLLSAGTIEKLRRHVGINEEQVKQCLQGKNTDLHEICIRGAETSVEIAEADLERKRRVHERMPNVYSALNVQRARAVAKVARLNLERTRTKETSDSVLSHLQWQIDELRDQVVDLQLQLEMSIIR